MARISKIAFALSEVERYQINLFKSAKIVGVSVENDQLVLFSSVPDYYPSGTESSGFRSMYDIVNLLIVGNESIVSDTDEYIGSVVLNGVDKHIFISR